MCLLKPNSRNIAITLKIQRQEFAKIKIPTLSQEFDKGEDSRCCLSCGFKLRAVALLVFLPGSAGAGIVSPDFLLRAHDLLHGSRVAASTRHACLF